AVLRELHLLRLADGDQPPRQRGVPHRQEAGLGRVEAEGPQRPGGGPVHPPRVPQGLGTVTERPRVSSPIRATVDYGRPGKQHGHLYIPYSHNLGGWANLMVPVSVVARGDGPTVLVLAGNHGDEYPGQVAILRLMRELRPEQVTGRIILIPVLSVPASKAATR